MIGQTVNQYRILHELGQGGMATVYLALDTELEREVALKVLSGHAAPDPDRLERFRREARTLAALNHPNIVTLYGIEKTSLGIFLAMELVRGPSLEQLIPAGGLPPERFFDIAIQVAHGLGAAHEKGVTHRDLKPSNVMVTDDGRVKILDFGLAHMTVEKSGETSQLITDPLSQGLVMGTVPYMSPEQIRGQPLDHRTDIFSFGVVLHQMATGQRPFRGDTPALIAAIVKDEPDPVSDLRGGLPARLDSLVQRCLAKEPPERFHSVRDLRLGLEELWGEVELGDTRTTTSLMPAAATSRRRKALTIGAAVVVIVLAAFLSVRLGRQVDPAASPATGASPSSVAVLPFVNTSGDPSNEYFSDGLTEELINSLARIPGLKVTSRTSAFFFKGKEVDLPTVAQKLGVAHVLEGSVRKDGERVRITTRLIEVAGDSNLWSQTYDRTLNDIFAVQQDVARSVAASLQVTLLETVDDPAQTQANAEAYNAFLYGRYFTQRRTGEDLERAVGYYRQALEIDPGFAEAWSHLAVVFCSQAQRGYRPVAEGFADARQAAERALALDPDQALAWAALAWVRMTYDWDWNGADDAFRRAAELEPLNPAVLQGAASLPSAFGRPDEALALLRRSVDVDPLNTAAHANRGLLAYRAGRLREARQAYEAVLDLRPGLPAIRCLLAQVDLAGDDPEGALEQIELETDPFWRLFGSALIAHTSGRREEADDHLRELIDDYHRDSAYQIAQVLAWRGEIDRSFEFLDLAYDQRDTGLYLMLGDPLLAALRGDPRWPAFLARLGLSSSGRGAEDRPAGPPHSQN